MNFKLIAPRKAGTTGLVQVLLNRGFTEKEIKHLLNTSDEDIIDPASIMNIADGAKMLVKHINAQTPTYLQVDSDCDGFTSSAILLNYLNNFFPYYVQNCIWYSFHDGKQHGIDLDAIPEDVKFIICPDASSEEYEKHKILKERGIDILIIDHHNAEHISENACVINNQLCDYPTKSLSGAGMVYKFCAYLDSLLQENKAEQYLDLMSLGCIADVMPLRDYELRRLINIGLANVNNPFLRAMCAKNAYSMKNKITPTGVAFYVAPTINAVTRIGDQNDKKILFDSMLEFKAYKEIPSTKRGCKGQTETVVEQAVRNSGNVKNHQSDFRDEFANKIKKQIEDENLLENKILTVLIEKPDENSKNITGLIANTLMGTYQRPVLLLSKVEENGEIFWRGSGRNVNGSAIESFQQFLKATGLVEYANGHDNALGVSIPDRNIKEFILKTNEFLKDATFETCHKVDIIFDNPALIDSNDILSIADADNLWGQGIEEPLIAITNIPIGKHNTALLQNKNRKNSYTLKITIREDLTVMKFGSSPEEYEALMPSSEFGITTIDLVGRCARNTAWDNNPQIMMEDYEIKKRNNYYF